MKKVIIFCLIFIKVFVCNCQNEKILQKNKLWSVVVYKYNWTIYTHFLKVDKDSIINDTTYSIIAASTDKEMVNWQNYALAREKDNKFYCRYKNEDKLFYDFNLKVGDTAVLSSLYKDTIETYAYKVVINDSIKIGNKYKRMMQLAPTIHPEISEIWIEGMGSLSGLFYKSQGSTGGDAYHLLCYKENDELLYIRKGHSDCYKTYTKITDILKPVNIKVYPNPVKIDNAINIEFEDANSRSVVMYNYQGKKIYESPEIFTDKICIPTQNFAIGIYSIVINDLFTKQVIQKKIIIY